MGRSEIVWNFGTEVEPGISGPKFQILAISEFSSSLHESRKALPAQTFVLFCFFKEIKLRRFNPRSDNARYRIKQFHFRQRFLKNAKEEKCLPPLTAPTNRWPNFLRKNLF